MQVTTTISFSELKKSWKFVDSPWDLLISCQQSASANKSSSSASIFCAFSHVMGFWSAYIFPILSVFGIIGNMITIYIFMVKFREKTRQLVYLSFLAFFDSANLICSGWMWIFLAKGLPYASNASIYFFSYNQSPLSCRLHRYFTASISCAAISIFLLTSIDRCCAIFMPFKFLNTPIKRAYIASWGVVLLSFVLMLPFLTNIGHTVTGTDKTLCWIYTLDNNRRLETFFQIYNVLFSFCGFFQTCAIITVNLALFIKLSNTLKKRRELQATAAASNSNNGATTGPINRKELSACVLLLVLSVIFTLCSLPTSVAFLLAFLMQNNTGENAENTLRFVYNIGDLGWHLYMVQQCTNSLVYYWKMPSYRLKINKLLCNKDPGKNSNTQTSTIE